MWDYVWEENDMSSPKSVKCVTCVCVRVHVNFHICRPAGWATIEKKLWLCVEFKVHWKVWEQQHIYTFQQLVQTLQLQNCGLEIPLILSGTAVINNKPFTMIYEGNGNKIVPFCLWRRTHVGKTSADWSFRFLWLQLFVSRWEPNLRDNVDHCVPPNSTFFFRLF